MQSIQNKDPNTRIVRLYLSIDLEYNQITLLENELKKIDGVTGVGYVSVDYIREASGSPTGKERPIIEVYSKDSSTISRVNNYASEKEGIEETTIVK